MFNRLAFSPIYAFPLLPLIVPNVYTKYYKISNVLKKIMPRETNFNLDQIMCYEFHDLNYNEIKNVILAYNVCYELIRIPQNSNQIGA